MFKNYKIGFELSGLILFLIIMIPNFIWFAVPAPNDVLRQESVTKTVDLAGSVCQVLMITSLCVIINRKREIKRTSPLITGTGIFVLLYFACWIRYYTGACDPAVLLGLTLFPCMAFLLYSLDRKNMIAFFWGAAFAVCHMIYTMVNFIIQVRPGS